MIDSMALLTAVLTAMFIFAVMTLIAEKLYSSDKKEDDKDWLFHNFSEKLYDAIYAVKDPGDVAAKLGLSLEKYYDNCLIAKTEPKVKSVIMYALYGIGIMMVSCAAAIFSKGTTRIVIFGAGFGAFAYLYYYQQHKLDKKAEKMKDDLGDEIPRFVGLLYAELQIGMNVEDAIRILCERMEDSLLAYEFTSAFNESQMGYRGWQDALEGLAFRYNIPTLNIFVQNIVTAYDEGVSITETVARISKEINENHLLKVKERAGIATNTLLIPIALFQFLPMIVFLMYPALSQLSMSGIGF